MGLGEINLSEHVLVSKAELNKLEEMVRVLIEKDSNAISSKIQKDILHDEDVCEMLNIKPKTLSVWRSTRKIPFYKSEGSDGRKGKCYYKLEEIKAFMLGVKHNSNTELSDEADSHMLLIKRKRLLRKNKKIT
jgi:hypothetical protein